MSATYSSDCDIVLSELPPKERAELLNRMAQSEGEDLNYHFYEHGHIIAVWEYVVVSPTTTTTTAHDDNKNNNIDVNAPKKKEDSAAVRSSNSSRGYYFSSSCHHSPSVFTGLSPPRSRRCRPAQEQQQQQKQQQQSHHRNRSGTWLCRSACATLHARLELDASLPRGMRFSDFVEYFYMTRFGLPKLAADHRRFLVRSAAQLSNANSILRLFTELYEGRYQDDPERLLCLLRVFDYAQRKGNSVSEKNEFPNSPTHSNVTLMRVEVEVASIPKIIRKSFPGIWESGVSPYMRMFYSNNSNNNNGAVDCVTLAETVAESYDVYVLPALEEPQFPLPMTPRCLATTQVPSRASATTPTVQPPVEPTLLVQSFPSSSYHRGVRGGGSKTGYYHHGSASSAEENDYTQDEIDLLNSLRQTMKSERENTRTLLEQLAATSDTNEQQNELQEDDVTSTTLSPPPPQPHSRSLPRNGGGSAATSLPPPPPSYLEAVAVHSKQQQQQQQAHLRPTPRGSDIVMSICEGGEEKDVDVYDDFDDDDAMFEPDD
eukprot:PhM_4_TR17440/c1_g1_i1/m.88642